MKGSKMEIEISPYHIATSFHLTKTTINKCPIINFLFVWFFIIKETFDEYISHPVFLIPI